MERPLLAFIVCACLYTCNVLSSRDSNFMECMARTRSNITNSTHVIFSGHVVHFQENPRHLKVNLSEIVKGWNRFPQMTSLVEIFFDEHVPELCTRFFISEKRTFQGDLLGISVLGEPEIYVSGVSSPEGKICEYNFGRMEIISITFFLAHLKAWGAFEFEVDASKEQFFVCRPAKVFLFIPH